jgi:hypothetical protein
MAKTTRYEVVEPHRCDACDQLIGQTTDTRAWLMPPREPCEDCDKNLAALYLMALWGDLKIVHLEKSDT